MKIARAIFLQLFSLLPIQEPCTGWFKLFWGIFDEIKSDTDILATLLRPFRLDVAGTSLTTTGIRIACEQAPKWGIGRKEK